MKTLLTSYLQHLPTCTTKQNWDEALDALSRCPDEPDKQEAYNEIHRKRNTCSCGYDTLISFLNEKEIELSNLVDKLSLNGFLNNRIEKDKAQMMISVPFIQIRLDMYQYEKFLEWLPKQTDFEWDGKKWNENSGHDHFMELTTKELFEYWKEVHA